MDKNSEGSVNKEFEERRDRIHDRLQNLFNHADIECTGLHQALTEQVDQLIGQLRATYSSQLFLPTIEDPNYERSVIGGVEQQLVEVDDALRGLRNLVQKVHTMKSVIHNFREETQSDDLNKTNEVLHGKHFDSRNEYDDNNLQTPTYDGESGMP